MEKELTGPNQNLPTSEQVATSPEPAPVISSRVRKNIALKKLVNEMNKATENECLEKLKADWNMHALTLFNLRVKHDWLQNQLIQTRAEIAKIAAEVTKGTQSVASVASVAEELNGKGKKS